MIPESVALPASALDKSKPGFKVRVVQATGAELPNTLLRTEQQLAGFLIDSATGQPYENIADLSAFNADGTYDEAGSIAYADGSFPGIPGTESTVISIALEAITFVELQPGTYTMVVNSDDGFRVSTGNVYDRLQEITLGQFDGGRGAGDTVFSFTVSKAGAYPFRLIYMQGGGGYSVNWFTADNTDPSVRTLLNEAGGLASYRALTTNPTPNPYVVAVNPSNGAQNVGPSAAYEIKVKDGSASLNRATLKLTRDGVDVTAAAQVTQAAGLTTVTHQTAVLPDPLAVVTYVLTFDDTGSPVTTRDATLTYTVAPYANFTLPAPIWIETFETTEEGEVPTGWRLETPFEDAGNYDLTSASSDSYLKFVVISKGTLMTAFGGAATRLNTPEAYINGQKVDSLVQGKFLYGESDTRGGSQIQYAYSPAQNLTGKSDIHLVYNSIYTQNQDNIAGVEYSIDGGTTWLPVVYMIDEVDIVKKADGTTDAEATLTAVYTDTARFTDPNTGEEVYDGSYGAFIGAARATWPDLAPYISGRIDDNQTESKRIEKFRLPLADNQASVTIRLIHAGTASWYFGVDNIGLYSITTIDPPALTAQPANATSFEGTPASFTVGATGPQLTYKWQFNGQDIPNATSATYEIAAVSAANAGEYRAVISNPSGSVTSAAATLTVALPTDNSTLRQDLAVYLPFENNYNDISGANRNGSAVGTPTFAAGKVGAAAVRVTNVGGDTPSRNYVTLGSNDTVPFGQTKDFTVAFWMKSERVSSDPAIVGTKDWNSGNNSGWIIGTQDNGRIEWNYRRTGEGEFSRKDLDYTAQGNILNNGTWAHVLVVWNINGNAETYYNGRLVDSQSITPGTGDLSLAELSLNLGQDGTGAYGSEWDGLLDEVAFWDRALTATEAATVFGYGFRGESFLAEPSTQPTLTYTVAAGQLTLNWQGAGFTLQENADLGSAAGWAAVAGAGANSATVPVTGAAKFYRLRK
ncbi:MAG: LamG-like jellyroll fold domain-containing protein [Limisphaerales bacterium]